MVAGKGFRLSVFCFWALLFFALVGGLFVGLVSANPVPAPTWPMVSGDFAMMMVMMWPFVPMFLVEVHFATSFWRKLGLWTYGVVLLEWLPVAAAVYLLQDLLVAWRIGVAEPIIIVGVLLVAAGIVLHLLTLKLLGLKATVGYTELKPESADANRRVVTSGPFSVVRHPSYWAHTFIFVGVFLMTGVVAVAVVAVVDFLIAYFVTTELEERELLNRFGDEYGQYQDRVGKFFPRFRQLRKTSHA